MQQQPPLVPAADAAAGVRLTGRPPQNPYIHEWLVADIEAGSDGTSLIIDASGLNGSKVSGVKYAYGARRPLRPPQLVFFG
jgi:hypothetical protein